MQSLELRPATADDGDFLYELHRRALGPVIEATWGPWDDEVQRRFHRAWFKPGQIDIVLVDGQPAGMVQAALLDANTFYISRIEVDPQVQNRGVGTALMHQMLDRARQGAHQPSSSMSWS